MHAIFCLSISKTLFALHF